MQAEGYDGELSPAQWMALRYFARANPFSRTPSAFAAFQATTRGTASQAIKALEASGWRPIMKRLSMLGISRVIECGALLASIVAKECSALP